LVRLFTEETIQDARYRIHDARQSIIHHTKAVRRGIKRAFLIGDLPFISYRASTEEAIME